MGNVKEAEWSFWLTLTSVSNDFFLLLSDTNIRVAVHFCRPGVSHPSALFEQALW